MASAPFSSPPAHPVSHTVNGAYADDCTFWATAALANDAKDSSPLVALNSICQVRANLTMSSERAIAEDDSEDGRKRALCIRTDISVDVQLKDGSAKNFSIVAGADLTPEQCTLTLCASESRVRCSRVLDVRQSARRRRAVR